MSGEVLGIIRDGKSSNQTQKSMSCMVAYPIEIMIRYVMNELGTPLVMKVPTLRYALPRSSVIQMAVTLGKPEVGKPMAAEHNKALAMINNLGWGSSNLLPISETSGITMSAATV